MIIFAHRGNLYGPDPRENAPAAIDMAIAKGFHVEVDIISNEKGFIMLGHDKPQYVIPNKLWSEDKYASKIIWHAKDIHAMNWAIEKGLHCFGHNVDGFVLTSMRYIWTCYPDLAGKRTIIMSAEAPSLTELPYGVCTDHPCRMKDFLDYKY